MTTRDRKTSTQSLRRLRLERHTRHELVTIVDRSRAIAHAITKAAPVDVVLIAGKGHESYQLIGGQKLPFSDLAQAQAALVQRADAAGGQCRH